MKLRWLLVLAFAGTHGVVLSGHAAEPLRLEEAVARSLSKSPSLAAEAAELRAAQARADRGGLAAAYVVGGGLENVGGTGVLSGVSSAETTVRLGRVIELGGKRAARQALGHASVALQRNLSDTARIEITSRATARFIKVVADQQRVAFAAERVKAAERTCREVATWVAAARNPESDLSAAEIAVAEAELALEHAEHELTSARMTLAASWGSLTPDFVSVAGDLSDLPAVEPFERLATRLPQTAAQRNQALKAEEITARRRVAVTSAAPDVDISIGVRRLEALNDQGLVMSVSVPLGSKPRASLAIAEADAQLDALQSRRDAQRAEDHQALFDRYQELVHARVEFDAISTRMLPKAESAYAFTQRGFNAGRFSFISLSQAQTTLFELRARRVEAAARYHTVLVEIERLTTVVLETQS